MFAATTPLPSSPQPCGKAPLLHVPFTAGNYGLDGSLKAARVRGRWNFERAKPSRPIRVETWESWSS